jgi:hypothetical protein
MELKKIYIRYILTNSSLNYNYNISNNCLIQMNQDLSLTLIKIYKK